MDIKVSFKDKNKPLKNVTLTDLPSFVAELRKLFPDIPKDSQLKYMPDKQTGIFSIDSGEAFKAMLNYKKVRLFIEPTQSELAKAMEKARGSSEHQEQKTNKIQQPSNEKVEQTNQPQEIPQSQPLYHYYTCRICSKKYSDGVRYRCLACKDFDVCESCFNKASYRAQAPHNQSNEEHEFVSIQSRKQWQSYDFRALIRLLLDTDYRAREQYYEMPPIRYSDIINQSKQYLDQIQYWQRQYERRVNNDIDEWIQDFQKLKQKQIK